MRLKPGLNSSVESCNGPNEIARTRSNRISESLQIRPAVEGSQPGDQDARPLLLDQILGRPHVEHEPTFHRRLLCDRVEVVTDAEAVGSGHKVLHAR